MGGDAGPRLTVPAAVNSLQLQPHLSIILFGDSEQINGFMPPLATPLAERLRIHHCSQAVDMEEKPSSALRGKRQSSMWLSLQAIADGDASACVSAGNTGALMAMGMATLGLLPAINRPAICTSVPTLGRKAYLLDLGANLECSADQLFQFALMASLLVSSLEGITAPVIGLLNVGHEHSKGHPVVREAAELMAGDKSLNFQGFVEGDAIYKGGFDVVVCDGFVGNVALKCSEGVARMIGTLMRQSLAGSFTGKLAALLGRSALRKLQERIDPARYNGASFLGLNGVVVKSHGGSSQRGFERAIEVAMDEAARDVPGLIRARLNRHNSP